MKKLNVLTRMLLLVALLVGSTSVWGQVATATATDGKTYVVAYYANSKYYALPHNTSAGVLNGTEVTLNAINKVNTTIAASLSWTLTEGTTAGQFYLSYTSGNKTYYLYKNGTTSNSNYNIKAKETSDDKHYWEFTSTNSGNTYKLKSLKSTQGSSTAIYLGYDGANNAGKYGVYAEANAAGIILLEIGNAPAFSITATSNNEDMGTVSLDGSTITASPKSGYRVKSGTDGYTVTNGTATVTNNGNNTFTVTPTSACTVQINFEAIPTRTITVTSPSGGTITVMDGESVVTSGSSVDEGTELTITAVAGANKEFASWSVTGATPASTTDAETTFTVGENNVTIAATFNDVVTHEIKWSVNGEIVKTESIKEGNAITFNNPESVPTGYTFMGWSASAIATPQATATGITYVTEAASTADITYYAVLAISTTDTYELVTDEDDLANGDKIILVSVGSYTASKKTYDYSVCNSGTGNVSYLEYANVTVSDNKVAQADLHPITLVDNNGKWQFKIDNKYMCHKGNKQIGFQSEPDQYTTNHIVTITSNVATIKLKEDKDTVLTCNPNSGNFRFNYYAAKNKDINIYKQTIVGQTTNYCTTATVTVTIGASGFASYCSANALDFTDSDVNAYAAKVSGTNVVLTKVDKVPANEGVVLYCETSGNYDIPVIATADDVENNEMVGVTERTQINWNAGGKYNYILQGGQFNKANGGYLKANRAYLSTTYNVGSGAKPLTIVFNDDEQGEETDGIKAVSTKVENGVRYNLAGQRVGNDYKGIVVVNGKKMLNK